MAPVLHGRRSIQAQADVCVYGDLQPERPFYAHRLLLMCISPYFEKVFRYRAAMNLPLTECTFCCSTNAQDQSTSSKPSCAPQTTGDQQKDMPQNSIKSSSPEIERMQTIASPENKENAQTSQTVSNSSNLLPSLSVTKERTFIQSQLNSSTSLNQSQSELFQICDCLQNTSNKIKANRASSEFHLDPSNDRTFETLFTTFDRTITNTTPYQWFDTMQLFLPPPTPDQPLEQLKLAGLNGDQVEALLKFAYDGFVELTGGNVQSLCVAADMYCVQALFDQCQQFLINSLCIQNCVGIFVFAEKLQCLSLKMTAERFVLRNFEAVSTRSTEFPRFLSVAQMRDLLSQHRLFVSDEYIVFTAIVRWIQYDRKERLQHFVSLFRCVRLALMSEAHLLECVLSHELVVEHSDLSKLIRRVILGKSQLQTLERPNEQLLLDLEMQAQLTPRFPIDMIFVFGGRSLDVEFVPPEPVVEVYDHRAERWRQVPSLQDPLSTRDHHQTVVFDGNVYMLGGHSGPFNVYNSCRQFNLKTKTWSEIAPMREKRAFLAAVVFQNSIYAIGGYNGAWRVDTAEKYNVKTNQWQAIASMHERRSGAGAAVLNDRIYVVGGFRDLTYLNTAEFYCAQTNTWTMIGLMQKPRSSPSVVSLNGFIYAIGGLTAGGLLASGERYDPATGTWTLLEKEMFEKKCSAASVVLEGKIFIIGGWNGVTGLNTVELWCLHSKRWLLGSKLSKRRTGCSACVVSDVPDIEAYAWKSRENLLKERFLNSFVEPTTDSQSQSEQMQLDG